METQDPLAWFVEMRKTDGSIEIVPFHTEYAAQNYVAMIPVMQEAGNVDFDDVAGAIIRQFRYGK